MALGNALNPLGADVELDVTPSTGTLYGVVEGTDGFGLDSVTVDVNGKDGHDRRTRPVHRGGLQRR